MSDYWEERAAWDLYAQMKEAEKTADQIARVYRAASAYIVFTVQDIFEKFRTKHKLSKAEAWTLMNTVPDRDSIQKLLLELKNKDSGKNRQEILRELEGPAYRARIERLQDLLQQVDSVMKNVYQQEQQFDTSFFEQLAGTAYYKAIYNMQVKTGLGFGFSNINQKQIEQTLRINWSGKHYSKRIWKNTEELARTIKDELLVSLLTGRTDRETAAVITAKFGGGAIQARRLVRTESCFLSGELTARAYEECGVKKYRYLATLDLRTSKLCRDLDGKIFLLTERQAGKNYPPMHPWCRSTTISVIDKETLRNMKRSAYNPESGRIETVPADMTYNEWYQKYVRGKPKAEVQEKAVKNAASDRKQYDRYRKRLGKDVPKHFADFQEMKYNEPEKWKFMKLDYQRRTELQKNPDKKLPNAESAILPEGKFTKYLFDGDHSNGLAKGRAISSRLGYSIENWQELQDAIRKGAAKYPAVKKVSDGHGQRYEQKMILMGLKNNPANIVVGWIQRPNGEVSMTSAYLKEV